MEKGQIKILVVEDDATFAEALKAAITKAGYSPAVFKKPDEALAAAKVQVYQAAVIDCMLPKMSGVDLAVQLRSTNEGDLHLILISGIYKDKGFIKDSTAKTKAALFMTKPFNVEDLMKNLDDKLKDLIDEEKTPLLEIDTKPQPTPSERAHAISNTQTIHGFELPRVVGLLMHPAINGTLQLKDPEGNASSIGLSGGKVIKVGIKDNKSFFGALLVEKNLVRHEVVEEVLKQPNPGKKRVGERLIEANLMSPHMVSMINTEQMAIRLSKLVADTSYEISFQADAVTDYEGSLDWPQITVYMNDWISSKITAAWLNAHYLPWREATVVKSQKFSATHPVWAMPILARLPELKNSLDGVVGDKALPGIHLLLLTEMIAFQPGMRKADMQSQLARLKKIHREMEMQNDFEVLGVNNKTNSAAIKKSYHDLSKSLHPDKLPPGTSTEVVELTRAIFTRMTQAYNHIGDDAKRAEYVKELEKGKAEKVFQAEGLLEEGKALLKSNQAAKALEKFRLAAALRPSNSELILHSLWARMAGMAQANTSDVLKEAEQELGKIMPEDRHNALYYFVKGLFQKAIGDLSGARSNFSHAVSQQPDFVEAKRELNLVTIQGKDGGKKDLLKADIGDLLGGLFKKR